MILWRERLITNTTLAWETVAVFAVAVVLSVIAKDVYACACSGSTGPAARHARIAALHSGNPRYPGRRIYGTGERDRTT